MTKILRICIVMLLAVLLLPVELSAQSRRDKEQTYVLDQPYEVTKITPCLLYTSPSPRDTR